MVLVLYIDFTHGECREDVFTELKFAKMYMFDEHIQVLNKQVIIKDS